MIIQLQRSYIHLGTDYSDIVAIPFQKRTRKAGTIGDVELFSDGEYRPIGGAYPEVDVIEFTSGPVRGRIRDKLHSWRGRTVLVRTPFYDRFWAMLHSMTDNYDVELDNPFVDQIQVSFLRVEDVV